MSFDKEPISHKEAVDRVNQYLKRFSWFRYACLAKMGKPGEIVSSEPLKEIICIYVNNITNAKMLVQKSYYGYPAYYTKYKHDGKGAGLKRDE